MTYDERLRPTPLETAAGMVFGLDPAAEPLPAHVDTTPREALRAATRMALRRPPCIVAFSGGRDSSALLALACDVARQEALPLPVPVTMRFPGRPDADETQWQEMVIRHLRLDDWVRLEFDDELDYVGPWAQRVLTTHGVLWPGNDYAHLPLLEQAGTGSLIDGVDGDSVFSSGYFRLMQALRGRRRPGRAALRQALFLLKSPAARRAHAYRHSVRLPWLTPAAQHEMSELLADDFATEPFSYADRLRWYQRSRYVGAIQWTTQLFAADTGTAVVRPLLDPTFLTALAQMLGAFGFKGRADMMRRLFGDLLPPAVVSRTTKASFGHYWGDGSRTLAAEWQGDGVDTDYVDPQALRQTWAAERIDHRSALLIQQIWLGKVTDQSASTGSI